MTDSIYTITPREQEVLRHVQEGLSNPEIADALGIGLDTVKTHMGNLLFKFYVDNRTQLAIKALTTTYRVAKHTYRNGGSN
jgi:DNA-binding NarL/FixJ family response regulator